VSTPTATTEATPTMTDPKGLPPEQRPRHVAIIMDGNGRWAEAQGLPRIFGHRTGIRSVRSVVEEGCRIGLDQLTLYCFSSENWKRPNRELRFLFRLLRHFLIVERAELAEQNVRLTMIGRREGLPDDVLAEFDRTAELTAANAGMTLCLAVNYGARAEITEAARRLVRDAMAGRLDPDRIDEEAFAGYLDTAGMPDPDLLIRTAGELRLSNYLLWQISYAELYVTEVLWPDFRAEHLQRAVLDYARRHRKFGGLPGRVAAPLPTAIG
jgi:undecaprenyl diphosphate synthase